MAGGLNKKFKDNPQGFLEAYRITLRLPAYQDAPVELPAGMVDVDLVPINPNPGPGEVRWVRLMNYRGRPHQYGAEPVKAWFLPVRQDSSTTLQIDSQCKYMFTAELSGCLFAAYADPDNHAAGSITVEHFNASRNHLKTALRARAIYAEHEPNNFYYKILSPFPIPATNRRHVKSYAEHSYVIGVRTGANWTFYFRPVGDADLAAEL